MEYTFTWFIENYSYCLQKSEEALYSPEFFVSGLESTAWCIRLYPRGRSTVKKGWISLFLQRSLVDIGPDVISPKFELSLLGPNGSAVISKELQYIFRKGYCHGCDILHMLELFLLQQDTLLPQDTLSVCCKLWINEENIHAVQQASARTRIGTEHISFLHVVEGFRKLKPNKRKPIMIGYSTHGTRVTSSIYLDYSSSDDGRIILEIIPFSTEENVSKCNLFLLGVSGSLTKCGEEDNRTDPARKDISRLSLSLTRKNILDREEYLPDGKLTLLCQCSFSTGVKYQKIERTLHEIPSSVLNQINYDLMIEKVFVCSSVIDELKTLCSTTFPMDVELQTTTNSYPAHKILLCARSPVFKAMLTNDMKEKNTDCIQLEDVENDTVEKLLHFLYSDNIENTDWDSATHLYYAADKYAIEKLKLTCSSFLLGNLSTSNAAELLLLADNHDDSDLLRSVIEFILKHEEQVYGSKQWLQLSEINPILVMKTMLLKYKRSTETPLSAV